MNQKRVVAIIQARVGSTRLPRKVLKEIKGKTILYHVVERVKQCKYIDDILIATSNLEQDDDIVKEAQDIGVSYFRGSESDVLSRYYNAAKSNNADIVVRITSDCPLIDPNVTDKLVKHYLNNKYDIVTNAVADLSKRTYPRGLDTEVFSFEQLKFANLNAKEDYQREHVTPYIYENTDNIYYYLNDIDYSKYRWTLDTKEDFILINKIYNHFYNGKHDFYLDELVKFMQENPKLYDINKDVEKKYNIGSPSIIKLRKATYQDCYLLFDWANDEAVRANSFNSEKIDIETHKRWLEDKLQDKNTELYIILNDNYKVGTIRIENRDREAMISYSIASEFRGKGIGKAVLKHMKDSMKERKLVGLVKHDNIASIKSFESAGYKKNIEKDYIKFISI